MTETERRYTQIEKEALAITWACEKFSDYILGKRFVIETDHKPLVPLLGIKHLDGLLPRVLRFRLRLSCFDCTIEHVPGKHLYTADTLSCAPSSSTENDPDLKELAEAAIEKCIAHLPASTQRLDEYRRAQNSDPVCSLVSKHCQNGWPGKQRIDEVMKSYREVHGELSMHNNLLLFGSRIVVPASMQQETLRKLHQGHRGIQ